MDVMELHLFDFDGTMFRSPPPPAETDHANWWVSVESLTPPFVPEVPDHEWWVSSTVNQARESCADPNVVCVLCTGREETFRERIQQLLHDHGLSGFDQVILKPDASYDTTNYKCEVMAGLHDRFGFSRIQVWEDSHQAEFKRFIEQELRIRATIHAVPRHERRIVASETATDFPEPDEMPESPTMTEWSDDLPLGTCPDHEAEFPPYDDDPEAGEPVEPVKGYTMKRTHAVALTKTALLEVRGGLPSATVEMFLLVLVSKLTQLDKRMQKKRPSSTRLGHFLQAAEDVEKMVSKYKKRDDPEAIEALRQALLRKFISRNQHSRDPLKREKMDIPAVSNVLRQMRRWEEQGKLPSLTAR